MFYCYREQKEDVEEFCGANQILQLKLQNFSGLHCLVLSTAFQEGGNQYCGNFLQLLLRTEFS